MAAKIRAWAISDPAHFAEFTEKGLYSPYCAVSRTQKKHQTVYLPRFVHRETGTTYSMNVVFPKGMPIVQVKNQTGDVELGVQWGQTQFADFRENLIRIMDTLVDDVIRQLSVAWPKNYRVERIYQATDYTPKLKPYNAEAIDKFLGAFDFDHDSVIAKLNLCWITPDEASPEVFRAGITFQYAGLQAEMIPICGNKRQRRQKEDEAAIQPVVVIPSPSETSSTPMEVNPAPVDA